MTPKSTIVAALIEPGAGRTGESLGIKFLSASRGGCPTIKLILGDYYILGDSPPREKKPWQLSRLHVEGILFTMTQKN